MNNIYPDETTHNKQSTHIVVMLVFCLGWSGRAMMLLGPDAQPIWIIKRQELILQQVLVGLV